MYIQLIERIVKRCTDPKSTKYNKILACTCRTIDVYQSSVIPRKGEIIFVDEKTSYDVVEVIYQKCCRPINKESIISVLIEVVPHNCTHTIGNDYSITEEWPLVASLESN